MKSNPKGKYWKKRWCVLTPDELLYFKNRASVRIGEPPRGRVDLSAANLLTGPGGLKNPETPFVMRLVSGRRTYFFCAPVRAVVGGVCVFDAPQADAVARWVVAPQQDATKLAEWCGALLVATQGGVYNSEARSSM